MMPVQLYFPDGVPKNIERIVGRDKITKEVIEGLVKMERGLMSLSRKARDIIHKKRPWWKRVFSDPDILDPEWLHWALFDSDVRDSLPKDQRLRILFLVRLAQLDPRGHKPVFPRGDAPTDDEIKSSVAYLAKEARSLFGVVSNRYIEMVNKTGRVIAPLCAAYGEDCDEDEAAMVANGDIHTMKEIGRWPGLSPEMGRLISAFLDLVD